MADTKITALAAIATVDPAADVLPIVDISDTSMAASGTTKKVTSNQILGAGGTATLASATITGDLTVDTSTLKVDSTNNRVGVNTATPSYPLHVVTNSVATMFNLSNIDRTTANWVRITNPIFSTDASAGLLLRPFPDSDSRQGAGIIASGGGANGVTDLALFVSSGSSTSTSFAVYGTTVVGSSVEHKWFQSAGSTAMTLNSTGNLVLKGGTAAATGVGVTFPATQVASSDANCLDDYEEGTWTPTDGSGAGLAFTVSNCRYTKVGRAVTIQGTVAYPVTANGSNALWLGFPFTAADIIFLSVGYTDASIASFTYLSGVNNAAYLLTPGVNTINSTLSGKSITFFGTYMV